MSQLIDIKRADPDMPWKEIRDKLFLTRTKEALENKWRRLSAADPTLREIVGAKRWSSKQDGDLREAIQAHPEWPI